MKGKLSGFIVSLIAILSGLFLFMTASSIPVLMENDVGSAFFPKVIAISLLVLGIFKLLMTILQKNVGGDVLVNDTDISNGIMTVFLLAGYVLLFGKLGFILSSVIYLFLQMMVLSRKEERKVKVFLPISVIVPMVLYGLFVYIIKMPLPKGILNI